MHAWEEHMAECLSLAEWGRGHTSPNPLVGAVVLNKKGAMIGQGFHRGPGQPHAEIEALDSCTESPIGGTLVTNLEPCCHSTKRTPPCTERLIQEKLSTVVIGCLDANPQVSGQGVIRLKQHGLEVITGVLESECQKLNREFFHYIQTKTPFVTLKLAQTLDGKLATNHGDSYWITDEKARAEVHRMRAFSDAVMVGAGTFNTDNPHLSVRLGAEWSQRPYRIVVGELFHLNPDAHLFHDELVDRTIVATTSLQGISSAEQQYVQRLKARGVHVWELPEAQGQVDLQALLVKLGEQQVMSLLVEGGGQLAASLLKQNLINRWVSFIAPKILGEGRGYDQGLSFASLGEAFQLQDCQVETVGNQVLMSGKPWRKQLSAEEVACLRA